MGPIVNPFPGPSVQIREVLDQLRLGSDTPPVTDRELRALALQPRPWDPASCPPELRCVVLAWLDEVVAWVNEEHTWRVDRVIPSCWLEHPHIVHELAAVACLRWEAEFAATATVLLEWHRHTLPMFLDGIVQRIGSTGCPPGRHQPHPGETRNALYRGTQEAEARRRRRETDNPY